MEEVLQRLLGVLDKLTGERGVPAGDSSVDKNIVKSPNSTLDNGKKVSGNISTNEKKRLKETFSLFNKMFFDYKKKEEPDTKEKAKLSQISKTQATPPKAAGSGTSKSGFGSIVGGLLLLVGGLAAFVTGLMTNGPFKGILKLLAKGGIKGGVELLKGAVKPFIEIIGKIIKFPFKILGKIGKFFREGFGKIGKLIFGEGEKIGGKVASKVIGKIGGEGIGKMFGKFIGKFAKVFKRIPIVGTLISIAFAWSRFSSGDIVGGTIDVLSGLAGLLDIAVPGLGTTLSIGLDVLNAVLDVKSDNGPGKPPTSKLDILKDMAGSVGAWIWDNRKYIPILSSVDAFVDSYNSFKSGNIMDGLGSLGIAIGNLMLPGLGDKVSEGFSWFMGFFESTPTESTQAPKPNNSFMKDISSLIYEKLAGLWKWMKDTVIDGIKKYIPGGKRILEFGKDFADETKAIAGKVKDRAVEFYGDFIHEAKAVGGEIWDKAKSVTGGIIDSAKGMLKKAGDSIGDMFKSAKESVTPKEEPKEYNDALSLLGKGILGMMGKKPKTEEQKAAEKANSNTLNGNKSATASNTVVVGKDDTKNIGNILAKNTSEKTDMFVKLYQANLTANQLLTAIVNNTAKAFTGSGGTRVSSPIVMSQSSPQEAPMTTIPNNRASYRSSPYAI